ncbi:NAD(P)-dependent dehydrogenase (short-subunit alcohol dehydrogenase family) [Mucilaginibacter frigoritolerans]|uniref:NAD(P)-dependent dehydrogenase (Short-subunit alcohol dehydrogenase family) n=1 Tax=Mucilaginibacter frigoritolerans TaxID=652788 RepID=A0A562TS46_9SPHI|nr:SDR family oxidoreductase [Mucilaginibacter frigoritolerans]TWI96375.1 NAD(P)-dependent dehydrogenase (short-subunit alcohol dehydrogenase family) [Mucilaginibacter frigoritolerans]
MYKNNKQFSGSWAIILGGSSGFGMASVEKLAMHGMNIAALYRETAITDRALKEKFTALAAKYEVQILPFNINALDVLGRNGFIEQFSSVVKSKYCVKLLLHSIARGNLKPLISESSQSDKGQPELSIEDIRYTTYAMATSILDWARTILDAELFEEDARIIGLTSEGAHKYWDGYAAVSIAKASLESLTTYMAVELSKFGLKTNLIQAGITETPSLKMIPESDKLIEVAKQRNPLGRITKPEDVANVIYLLCTAEAAWINGALIHVDGGEHCK